MSVNASYAVYPALFNFFFTLSLFFFSFFSFFFFFFFSFIASIIANAIFLHCIPFIFLLFFVLLPLPLLVLLILLNTISSNNFILLWLCAYHTAMKYVLIVQCPYGQYVS